MTNFIPVFEFLSLDDASKAKAKTFIEKVDHAIKSFGVIVRDNRPIEWLQKVLPTYLFDKLKLVGYKTRKEDFILNLWFRFFNIIDFDDSYYVFFDHETALKGILDSGEPLDALGVREYKRFVEVLAYALGMGLRGRIIHYPGVVRNESEAYQRLYGGLALAAAQAGAVVCDSSLGYAQQPTLHATIHAGVNWIPNQNAASKSIRYALVGAHGSQAIAPMLYTRDEAIKGWPMTEFPRLEKTYDELGYGPVMVHLGWGKLLELGEEWVRVFEGQS